MDAFSKRRARYVVSGQVIEGGTRKAGARLLERHGFDRRFGLSGIADFKALPILGRGKGGQGDGAKQNERFAAARPLALRARQAARAGPPYPCGEIARSGFFRQGKTNGHPCPLPIRAFARNSAWAFVHPRKSGVCRSGTRWTDSLNRLTMLSVGLAGLHAGSGSVRCGCAAAGPEKGLRFPLAAASAQRSCMAGYGCRAARQVCRPIRLSPRRSIRAARICMCRVRPQRRRGTGPSMCRSC